MSKGAIFLANSEYAPVGGVNSTYADQEVYWSANHRFVYNRYSTIVGGDFNCVENPAFDRSSYDAHKLNSYKSQYLISLCQTFNLHDALKITVVYFSYFTWQGPTVASRLDRFYVSTTVNVNLCKVQAVAASDHSFFHISVIIQQNQSFGPGFWKNNVSLYEDSSCYDYIVFQRNKWVNLRPIYSIVIIWWLETKDCVNF